MKIIVFAWITATSVVLCQESPLPLTIELRTGEKLPITKISKIEPDGVTIWTDSGPKKISVSKLAKSELVKYSLTEEDAKAHVIASNKLEAAVERKNQVARDVAGQKSAAEAAKTEVKFINSTDVKTIWVKRLPVPHSLDKNYGKIVQSYKDFINEIRSGKWDLDAQEVAAAYNKEKALQIGDSVRADAYEDELKRISNAKTEQANLAHKKAALAQQQSAQLQREQQARRDEHHYQMLESELQNMNMQIKKMNSANFARDNH